MELVRQNDEFIDKVEAAMQAMNNPVELPLVHTFTKGLYTRKIFMPAGTLLTSKIHKTQHQFAVLKGVVEVSIDGEQSKVFKAGDMGITEAGTRRMLFIREDTEWVTMHPIDISPENDSKEAILEAVAKIEDAILDHRENKLLNNKIKEPCHLPQLQLG